LTESREEYAATYDGYRGPIALLLELVQTNKVDLYQISLNQIISGFLDFIKSRKTVAINTMSSFIWTASVLLEIKSRSLLPSKKKDDQQQEPDQELLKKREQEYRVFKKIAAYLEKTMETEELFLTREAALEKQYLEIIPDFLEGISGHSLCRMAHKLLKGQPVQLDLDMVYNHRNIRSIYDEMERVRKKLGDQECTFRQLTDQYEQVIEVIICFLSILELYKNEEIKIIQFENFGNIIIKKI